MKQNIAVKTKENPFQGIIDEMKKVSWPSRKETIRLTTVVIAITLIVGLYIGIIDVIFAKILELLTKVR